MPPRQVFAPQENSDGTREFSGGISSMGIKISPSADPDLGFPFVLTDSAGRVLLGVHADGAVELPGGIYSALPAVSLGSIARAVQRTDYHVHGMYGQSLSVANVPKLWKFSDVDTLTFPQSWDGMALTTPTMTAFTHPVLSMYAGIHFVGLEQQRYLMTADDEYSDGYTSVGLGFGKSGQPISALAKGAVTYTHGLAQVSGAKALADAAGKTIGVLTCGWIQGESDSATAPATYSTALQQLVSDWNADVKAITGQTDDIVFLCHQQGTEQYFVGAGTDLEPQQVQGLAIAAAADPRIMIVGPTYWAPHRDGVHLTDDGYYLWGLLYGRALYAATRGERWRPLSCVAARRYSARTIVADFYVPDEGALAIDTTTVSDPGGYGFRVRDDGGEPTVTAVEIISPARVRINVDRDLTTNPILEYAWRADSGQLGGPTSGPRGCLRSKSAIPAYTTRQDGTTYDVYHWCIRFAKAIS